MMEYAVSVNGIVGRPPLARPVLRGGSWNNNPRNLRAANRNRRNRPDNRNNNLGFRVVRLASLPAGCKPSPGVSVSTDTESVAAGIHERASLPPREGSAE